MKILAIIPARGGSKGVPGKNIKKLHGKPLIQYSIESAISATQISRTILSTEDPIIQSIALSLGIEVPFIRPDSLAEDATPTLPVIQNALNWLSLNEGEYYDAVCLLQPTNPFRTPGFIDKAIECFIQSGADSLVSVLPVPTEFNPHWVFEPKEDGLLKIATGENNIIPRRQSLPPAFFRDGSIYLTLTNTLLKYDSLYGNKIGYIESDPAYYCNIDTMADWAKAETIAKELFPI